MSETVGKLIRRIDSIRLYIFVLLDELTRLKAEERENISEISAKIRMAIERIPISKDITEKKII